MLKRFALMFLFAVLLLGALPLQVSASMHDHKGGSPFDVSEHSHKPQQVHKIRCPLHGKHLDRPCPHMLKVGGKSPVKCAISQECHGMPSGTVPSAGTSISLSWGLVGESDFVSSDSTRLILPSRPSPGSLVSDPQSPPPKTV